MLAFSAQAQTPRTISYQGILTDMHTLNFDGRGLSAGGVLLSPAVRTVLTNKEIDFAQIDLVPLFLQDSEDSKEERPQCSTSHSLTLEFHSPLRYVLLHRL